MEAKEKIIDSLNDLIRESKIVKRPATVKSVENNGLLESVRDKMEEALENGVSMRKIWVMLRENGYTANCQTFSFWLDRNGIRKIRSKNND